MNGCHQPASGINTSKFIKKSKIQYKTDASKLFLRRHCKVAYETNF